MSKELFFDNSENGYLIALAKYIDPLLTDDMIGSGIFSTRNEALNYVSRNYPSFKPIVAAPYGHRAVYSGDNKEWKYYPNVMVVQPYLPDDLFVTKVGGSYPGEPPPQIYDRPEEYKTPAVIVGYGDTNEIRWIGGNKVEFIAATPPRPSLNQYPITSITQHNSTTVRITCETTLANSQAPFFWSNGVVIKLVGFSGTSNDLNGWHILKNKATVYLGGSGLDALYRTTADIDFNFGTGTPVLGVGQITFLSDLAAIVATQLNMIRRGRAELNGECSWWEARYCARMTGSQGGVSDDKVGYGEIDTVSAIAYSDPIAPDEYLSVGSVGTLAGTYNSGTKKMIITIPFVENALKYYLVKDEGTENQATILFYDILDSPPNPKLAIDPDLTEMVYTYTNLSLGDHTYKYYAEGLTDKTIYSNVLTSSIPELVVTKLYRFNIGQTVYCLNADGSITFEAIVNKIRRVLNPQNDDRGVIEDIYIMQSGRRYTESKIGVTIRHLLWKCLGGGYFNTGVIDISGIQLDPFMPVIDICGWNLSGADLSELNFAEYYFHGCNLTGATLPFDITSKEDFMAIAKGYDPVTTIYEDGNPIDELL